MSRVGAVGASYGERCSTISSYAKRSNVEGTFNMIKQELGDTLKSKNPTAQKNELLCKIIACNITVLIQAMFELGIKPEFKM